MSDPIDRQALMKELGINDMDCEKCKWGHKKDLGLGYVCGRGGDFEDACFAIEHAPTIEPDRSLWFRIGETCVDESKGFISAGRAVEKIRELLREAGRRGE